MISTNKIFNNILPYLWILKYILCILIILLNIAVTPLGFLQEWSLTKCFLIGYVPIIIFLCLFKKIQPSKIQVFIFLAIFIIIYRIIFNPDNFTSDVLYWALVPGIMLSTTKTWFNEKKIFIYLGILIYLINCFVTIYEYTHNINLFYHDLSYFTRFRASGIWSHPLYSALIHGFCMLLLIFPPIPKFFKISLFGLGCVVLFCYDARAATALTLIASFLLLNRHDFMKKKNIKYILIFIIFLCILIDNLAFSELGGKLFRQEELNIKSNDPRMIAFDIFFGASLRDIIFGVSAKAQEIMSYQHNVICIENGIFTQFFTFGIFLGSFIFIILLRRFSAYMKKFSHRERIILLGYFFIVGATSQALSTPYLWSYVIVLYNLFTSYHSSETYKK